MISVLHGISAGKGLKITALKKLPFPHINTRGFSQFSKLKDDYVPSPIYFG